MNSRGEVTRGRGKGDSRKTGIYPKARKRFGQHFLERAWVDKLIAALGTSPERMGANT